VVIQLAQGYLTIIRMTSIFGGRSYIATNVLQLCAEWGLYPQN